MKGRYEDSPPDKREDRAGAKKAGMSLKNFEKTATEKRLDAAGQKKLNAKKAK
jgi:hypothetical protein